MNRQIPIIILILLTGGILSCTESNQPVETNNPFLVDLNEPIAYHRVQPEHIDQYATLVLDQATEKAQVIRNSPAGFEPTFVAYDDLVHSIAKARNNSHMLYWVSPDSMSRVAGQMWYQKLDSFSTLLSSDKSIFKKMVEFSESDGYKGLMGPRRSLVDKIIEDFRHSGVGLDEASLERFVTLTAEIKELSSGYSINMNNANSTLVLDEPAAAGLPDNFKQRYLQENGSYRIPVIPSTSSPVLSNATNENTRKEYFVKYNSRAAKKNLEILDQLVEKRYEIGQLMGKESYAAYQLEPKMAGTPKRVWEFIHDLNKRAAEKAQQDHALLKNVRDGEIVADTEQPIEPWNVSYLRNQYLKKEFNIDQEKIREYLPMQQCLAGMMEIYQELLDLQFRKVEYASVWHEEVEMYEVYEGETLKGRFYLDLYPRPNKESWYYGVPLTRGKQTSQGYEIPVSMLLGNFTRPTDDLPSLISHGELRTLFHEFGHIMDGMSYQGDFMLLSRSKADFSEAMSQIFENWIWDYPTISSFAKHYQTGEVLPKETFENMLAARNVTSGISLQSSLRRCAYDMMLYDKHDPDNPVTTDEIWRDIEDQFAMPWYVEGTHPQASWIHINTHPVYMYGYLWSRVYAQDMFTEFEKNGLKDTQTGKRYRELILANGTQRDIEEAIEDFLGRPSNNQAFIKSLGLE